MKDERAPANVTPGSEKVRIHPSSLTPRPSWRLAVSGFVLGSLLWYAAAALGVEAVPLLRGAYGPWLFGLLGAGIGVTRARPALWAAGGIVTLGLLAVGYTPLAGSLVRGLDRQDPLQAADAAVVLSCDVFPGGELPAQARIRMLRGCEVVRRGYSPRLILTRPYRRPSALPALRRQLQDLGLTLPIEELGPVRNTHEEADAIAKVSRSRGWKRVILVSDASHMRRSAALFRKAGVPVLCCPSAPREYDPGNLNSPGSRLAAFRDWWYEAVGYEYYRMKGWL